MHRHRVHKGYGAAAPKEMIEPRFSLKDLLVQNIFLFQKKVFFQTVVTA